MLKELLNSIKIVLLRLRVAGAGTGEPVRFIANNVPLISTELPFKVISPLKFPVVFITTVLLK